MKTTSLIVSSFLAFTCMTASVHAGERCTPAQADAWSDGGGSGEVCDVGIPSDRMAPITASQRMSQWCWAASIAMILTYHGHPIDQATIVQSTYGRLVNLPAYDGPTMTNALARPWNDARGVAFQAQVSVFDQSSGRFEVDTRTVIDELRAERPLLVGTEGHAMVVTAMRYRKSPGGGVEVLGVTVRDPWPGQGRRELSWQEMQPTYLATVRLDDSSARSDITVAPRVATTRAPSATQVPSAPRARAEVTADRCGCADSADACVSALPSLQMCVKLQAQQCVGECVAEGYPVAMCQGQLCSQDAGAWQSSCVDLLRWAVSACEDARAQCDVTCDGGGAAPTRDWDDSF